MEIRTDLVDAHLYAFNRLLVQGVLESRPGQKSIKHDLVPYLVRSQLRLGVSSTIVGSPLEDQAENINHLSLLDAEAFAKSELQVAHSGLKCNTYITRKDRYCSQVNSLQVKVYVRMIIASFQHGKYVKSSVSSEFFEPTL
jgi:translation initiation factor eIF-2B subunit gamma